MSKRITSVIQYREGEEISSLAATQLARMKRDAENTTDAEVEAYVSSHDKPYGVMKMTSAATIEDKQDIIDAVSDVIYNYGIELEEIEEQLTAKTLLNEPRRKSRYILLPMEVED